MHQRRQNIDSGEVSSAYLPPGCIRQLSPAVEPGAIDRVRIRRHRDSREHSDGQQVERVGHRTNRQHPLLRRRQRCNISRIDDQLQLVLRRSARWMAERSQGWHDCEVAASTGQIFSPSMASVPETRHPAQSDSRSPALRGVGCRPALAWLQPRARRTAPRWAHWATRPWSAHAAQARQSTSALP